MKNVEELYNLRLGNLRENRFYTSEGNLIVTFYTKRISDTKNDVLHCAEGPCVILGDGGEGNEFYFIDGEQVKGPEDERYLIAANSLGAQRPEVRDIFDVDDTYI